MSAPILRIPLDDHDRTFLDQAAFDARCGQFLSDSDPAGPIELDLTRIDFIHHEVLLMLIAFVRHRAEWGLATRLTLPESRDALDFLRSWNFLEGAVVGTTLDVDALIGAADRDRYFSQESPRYVRVLNGPGGLERDLPRSFFAVTPVKLRGSPFDTATLETARWLNEHVLSILDVMFNENGESIAYQVVQEALLNSASHPRADTILTTSQFRQPTLPRRSNSAPVHSLSFSIWDNGTTIGETLLATRDRLGTIAAPAFGILKERFHFRIVDREGEIRFSDVVVADGPGVGSSFESLILSAFFLGVSSDPHRTANMSKSVAEALQIDHLPVAMTSAGLGLFLVRRTLIDLLGGILHYSSGPYRLTLRRDPEGQADYLATMVILRSSDVQVHGNLLSARIAVPGADRADDDHFDDVSDADLEPDLAE